MYLKFATLSLLIFSSASCASRPSSRYPDIDLTVQGEATRPALAARLSDELTSLRAVTFRSADNVLTGRVLANGAVRATKAVKGYVVSVDLGSAQSLNCTVQDGVLGLSAFTRSLAEAFLASHDAHEYKYAFAGTNGSAPYLVLHGQYLDRGTDPDSRHTGFLKMVVAGRAELTVACFHDQFGYRETIERVALSLIDDLKWDREKPLQPLVRRSVYALREADAAIGSREVVIRADDEDFRRSWIRTAFLSLKGPQGLEVRDIVETYDSDPDGRVFAQTYEVREDGEVRVELSLKEQPMTDYEVSGHIDQKPTRVRFSSPEGLPDLLLSGRLRLSKDGFDRFLPALSVSGPTAVTVEKKIPTAQITVGQRTITGQLDAAGDWVRGTLSDGYSFERTAREPPAVATDAPTSTAARDRVQRSTLTGDGQP